MNEDLKMEKKKNSSSGIGIVKSYLRYPWNLTLSSFYDVGLDVLLKMLVSRKTRLELFGLRSRLQTNFYVTLSRSV